MSGKCLAIIWDQRQRVYGVRVEKNAVGALVLTDFAESLELQRSFSERLHDCYESLSLNGDELTVLGGAIPGMVCFEVALPALTPAEMREALGYQLRSLLPATGELVTAYRKIDQISGGGIRVRAEAIEKDVLHKLFLEIKDSGIRADLLMHPFMAVDPLLSGRELYVPEVEPDFSLSSPGADGLRSVRMLELLGERPEALQLTDVVKRNQCKAPENGMYVAAALQAAYLLSGDLRKNRHSLHLLPQKLRSRRFVVLRRVILILLLANVLMAGVWSWRDGAGKQAQYRALQEQLSEVKERTARYEKELSMIEGRRKLLGKFCNAVVAEPQLITFLKQLTDTLPNSMYVTGMTVNGLPGGGGNIYRCNVVAGKGAPNSTAISAAFQSLENYVNFEFLESKAGEGANFSIKLENRPAEEEADRESR